eukprot:m.320657 g.320657  ORF g.320657 m.320657 type:complete len:106 (+) comp20324_c1_seq1:801-1118(+)
MVRDKNDNLWKKFLKSTELTTADVMSIDEKYKVWKLTRSKHAQPFCLDPYSTDDVCAHGDCNARKHIFEYITQNMRSVNRRDTVLIGKTMRSCDYAAAAGNRSIL